MGRLIQNLYFGLIDRRRFLHHVRRNAINSLLQMIATFDRQSRLDPYHRPDG